MGAVKSRTNSAPCSKADFKNEETLNGNVRRQNSANGKNKNLHRQQKSGCGMKNKNGVASVVGPTSCPKPQMKHKNEGVCKNAMENCGTKNSNDRKHSSDAMTPEQQMEYIKKVYQKKTRANVGEISKSNHRSNGKGENQTNSEEIEKMGYQAEQRNGQRSIRSLSEDSQCRKFNEGRMAQLSEVEAMADAITENCCRARKKAEREKARNKRRCCTCNGEFKIKCRQQGMEADDDDGDTDTKPDIEIEMEVEEDCCYAQQRRAHARREKFDKWYADMRRRKQKYMEESELEEEYAKEEVEEEEEPKGEEEGIKEEEVVEEEATGEVNFPPAMQCKRQSNEEQEHYSQSRHAQLYEKRCKCCDCKKRHSTTDQTDEREEEEEEISVEDSELGVQEERNDEKAESLMTLAPPTRRRPQRSDGQEQKHRPRSSTQEGSQPLRDNSRIKESEQKALTQEKEMLLKKTNPYERPKKSDKEEREKSSAKELQKGHKPKQNENEQQESKTKARRSRSAGVQEIRTKSHEHVDGCRCCDYEKEKAEMEKRGREETSGRFLDIKISHGTKKARKISFQDEPPQNRRSISYGKEERQITEETAIADEPQSRRNNSHGRRKRNASEEKTTAEIEKDVQVPSKESKPQESTENDVQNGRQYERIQNQRNSQGSGSIKEDRQVREETALADEPQSRRNNSRGRRKRNAGEEETTAEMEKYVQVPSWESKPQELAENDVRNGQQYERIQILRNSQGSGLMTDECRCRYRKFHEDEYETVYAQSYKQRYRVEDRRPGMLVEELTDRLRKRAQQQNELQRRLQEQMRANQRQRCCQPPPPSCFLQFPCCCEPPMAGCRLEERPSACRFLPPSPPMPLCCCPPISPPPYCLPKTPPCYEPPPCYGEDCPDCCQPMPFYYTASCSYTKPGSST